MASQWSKPTSNVWRMVLTAGGTSILSIISPSSPSSLPEEDSNCFSKGIKTTPSVVRCHERESPFYFYGQGSILKWAQDLAKPNRTAMEAIPEEKQPEKFQLATSSSSVNNREVQEYDFVIIGHGIAGQSALKTLQKFCPQATLAVVDPTLEGQVKKKGTNDATATVDYYKTICSGFHPLTRQVQVQGNSTDDEHGHDNASTIRYRHAVLVATGSRGAPPPHYLMDDKALSRIFELRPTLLPALGNNDSLLRQRRPIDTPQKIRKKVLHAAKRGHEVAILGSGWDAVEMALALSATAEAHHRKKSVATLVFGGKGPLHHVLPQYLSAAVAKRLKAKKIRIQDRSLIRYIGVDPYKDNKLNLYTAMSFDLMDTGRATCEWLVVAPEVSGPMGTAALPTANTPSYLESARAGRAWYQTWSHLTTSTMAMSHEYSSVPSTNLIACYADDGRIAVNAELAAGNGVYAAGSVAKYPNPWTGNAVAAGEGVEDGRQAGIVAAQNMARDYQHRTGHKQRFGSSLLGGKNNSHNTHGREIDLSRDAACLKNPIPIWRSDQMAHTEHDCSNSLQEAGIHALCVGCCDSDKFSTQGFWWTNQSKRFRQLLGEDNNSNGSNNGSKANGSGRRVTKRNHQNKDHPSNIKPVYGRGIVFYMDQDAGQIQGVMIWGLPFTNNQHDNDSTLNEKLIHDIEETIRTNGGFSNLGLESELERVQFVQYLTERSRHLAMDSIEPYTSNKIQPDDLPRPLIRYTEVRPATIRRVRVLNRRQEAQGHGFLGEDLFARCSGSVTEVPPAPLPDFNNLREVNDSDADAVALQSKETSREDRTAIRRTRTQAIHNWEIWEWYQRRWEENEDLARPPKEELLWLRKGDENRGVSSRERFNAAMMKAIFAPDG